MNKISLSWASALRDLRHERAPKIEVCEEPLQAAAGLSSEQVLSAWRGISGRRYVVSIHSLSEVSELKVHGAVVLAVKRKASGTASLIEATTTGTRSHDLSPLWVDHVRSLGAEEVHIYRLAKNERERYAAMMDLIQKVDLPRSSPAMPGWRRYVEGSDR